MVPNYYQQQPYVANYYQFSQQQQQQQQQPGLNLVPWNYYHSEYLPDGRIRPALYPIAKHIPYGLCLPENSLCDQGHDEQCCGAASFCVNYWGLNKCVAYRQLSENDLRNPLQIEYNTNYKNYYNYWSQKARQAFMK